MGPHLYISSIRAVFLPTLLEISTLLIKHTDQIHSFRSLSIHLHEKHSKTSSTPPILSQHAALQHFHPLRRHLGSGSRLRCSSGTAKTFATESPSIRYQLPRPTSHRPSSVQWPSTYRYRFPISIRHRLSSSQPQLPRSQANGHIHQIS